MMSIQSQRIKILSYLSIALCILIFTIVYVKISIKNDFSGKLVHVHSILTKKEILTEEIISKLSNYVQSDLFDTVFFEENYSKLYVEEGLILLVFEDSTLKYWSDNSVVADLTEVLVKKNFAFLSNAWFEIKTKEIGNYLIVGLIKIKSDYDYENQYLKNQFQPCFHLPPEVLISEYESENNVYSKDGDFLFSLILPQTNNFTESKGLILTISYLILFILILVVLYHSYLLLSFYFSNSFVLLAAFVLDVLLLRFILLYFRIPDIVYSLPLFKPTIFASSAILPSLGDLLLNSFSLLVISVAIFKKLNVYNLLKNTGIAGRTFITALLLFILFLLFVVLHSTLTNIITNSSISFDLLNITKIDGYSLVALGCFGILILSFIFLTYSLSEAICKIYSSMLSFSILLGTMVLLFLYLCNFRFRCDAYLIIFILLYISYFFFIAKSNISKIGIAAIIYFLVLFSSFSAYIVHQTNNSIEKELRLSGAQKLANERDYAIEFMFDEISNAVSKDTNILRLIHRYPFANESEFDETINYLKKNYFTGYWDKYDILFTICDSTKVLDIQPENYSINCNEYFDIQIQTYGIPTQFENFIYLDYSTSPDNYLGKIEVNPDTTFVRIYVEVFSRLIPRGLGYPELLMDQKAKTPFNITLYSWAKYKNDELIYHYGKFAYSMSLNDFVKTTSKQGFFNLNRFNHLYFQKDKDTTLIISKKNPGLIDLAAPLSYFFIFYSLLLLLLILIFNRPLNLRKYQLHFKRRLQLSIISLVLISFIFTGLSSLFYIVSLNNNKNTDILKEKAHSVLIELEHKLSNEENLTPDMEPYLSVLLYKLSLVFFSDINLYDLNGTLLATSRAEVFNKGLVSSKMNSSAYNQLYNYRSSLFMHQESIGDYSYLSAYLPFRNVQNQTIAYLNLPYFAKQNELTNEIVTYLTAFINIYVILTAIAILITLVISNYISKPVQLLKDKISQLKLGKQNEKIDWVQHDEIGSLVMEYNRMVDELTKSAELLTKSERESAWREMAKQIAHEIKNPLTPMKLSVQYLQKAWEDKSPDWEQRLKRFTETLAEQIDSLSAIATAFSDFAKMPKSNFEVTELNKIIENAIRLFRDTQQIRFEFSPAEPHYVFADSEQLHRVFINLINNSIQAISDPEAGIIKISLEKKAGNHIILFSDNGTGIPDDQKSKVFYPNFTTKSGGMGLGLAMAKNIIQNASGEISFKTEEGRGTTFIISLPVYEE